MFSLLLFLFLLAGPVGEVADDCEALFDLINELDQKDDYQELYERAHEARTCFSDLADLKAQRAAFREAYALRELGRVEESLDLFNEALPQLDVSADSSFTRNYFINRGYGRYMAGQLSGAASDYSRALDFADDLPPDERAQLARDAGAVFQRIGNMETANDLFQQALAFLEEVDPSQTLHPQIWMDALTAQADLYLQQGQPQSALPFLEEAHPLQDDVAPQSAIALHNLRGDAYRFTSNTPEAKQAYERYLQLAHTLDDAHHVFRGHQLFGILYLQEDEYDSAEHHLHEAEQMMENARHDDYRRLLLRQIGQLYERQQKWEQAEQYYQRAVEISEQYRASLRASDWFDASFTRHVSAYEGLVRIQLQQEKPGEAFETVELGRARQLHDLRMQSQLSRELSPEDQEQFDELTGELSSARKTLMSDTLTATQRIQLSRQMSQASDTRSKLVNIPTFGPPTLKDLQSTLQADQVVLSYAIQAIENGRSDNLSPTVFALTSDTLVAQRLPAGLDSLETLLSEAHPAFTSGDHYFESSRSSFSLETLHHLYRLLIEPAAEWIPDNAHIIIIPDAPLFRLPFSALVTEPHASADFRAARYLLHDHPVSHLTAASLLQDRSEMQERAIDISIFGQSEYGAGEEEVNLPGFGRVHLSSLPAVLEEARAIESLFSMSSLFLNDDATTNRFFRHAPQSSVVHVAAHAFASGANSFIALDRTPQADGGNLLYLHELREHRLPVDLVVLSSCNTAVGSISQTDGMLGLQHAFRAAGAQSTLSTLWPTDDYASSRLMVDFYRELRKGASKSEALRSAQLQFLDGAPAYAGSPFFWAGPVLYGDASSLQMSTPSYSFRWMGALVLFLVVAFIVRRRFFSG